MPDALPQHGDLYVAINGDGTWGAQLAFIAFYDGRADVAIFRDTAGRDYLMQLTDVARPILTMPCGAGILPAQADIGTGSGTANGARASRPPRGDQAKITRDQRRMIFGLGRKLGFGIDDLRAMTPTGSISVLTRRQAADMIDALSGRPTAGGDDGTDRQRAYARDLAAGANMDQREFARWLHRNYRVDSIDDDRLSKHQLSNIINALQRIAHKRGFRNESQATTAAQA